MQNKDKLEAIQDMRDQLNQVDEQLASLLQRRFAILGKIFNLKRDLTLSIYDPKREDEIVQRVCSPHQGPVREYISSVFRSLLKTGRDISGNTLSHKSGE